MTVIKSSLFVFQLNASGVVIYDDKKSSDLEPMSNPPSGIPSVFTYNWKGREMARLARKYGRVVLRIHKSSKCLLPKAPRGHTCMPFDEWEDWQAGFIFGHFFLSLMHIPQQCRRRSQTFTTRSSQVFRVLELVTFFKTVRFPGKRCYFLGGLFELS